MSGWRLGWQRPIAFLAGIFLFATPIVAQPIPGSRMSHSGDSETVEAGHGVSCTNSAGDQFGTAWMRSYNPKDFDITGKFDITGISFAVEAAAGTGSTEQKVDVVIFSDSAPGDPILAADLVELRRETALIADSANLTVVTHTLATPLAVSASTSIVVSVEAGDLSSFAGRRFAVGANEGEQTGASWLQSATCGATDPLDLGELEGTGDPPFPLVRFILDVNYEGGCVAPTEFFCEAEGSDFLLTWLNSGSYTSLTLERDGEALATLEADAEEYLDVGILGPHTYLLRFEQDDFDCSGTSLVCQTGYTFTCASPGSVISSLLPPAVSTIEVLADATIDDVNVSVDISHTWIGDVAIELTGPDGTEVVLKANDTGDDIDLDDIVTTFDDEGLSYNITRLPHDVRVQPQGLGELSDFDETPAIGTWTLTVTDSVDFDDGILNTWCLGMVITGAEFFKRGDINGNGTVIAIPDAIALLRYQFTGGPEPPCMDAADADGNNAVSAVPDAIFLLRWGYTGGLEPPAPGPYACGSDDDLDGSVGCVDPPDACN